MALERPNRRKAPFSGTCDPRTYVAPGYPGQFYPGSWSEVFAVTGWRPSRAVIVHRSRLTDEAIRWLAEFNRLNPK